MLTKLSSPSPPFGARPRFIRQQQGGLIVRIEEALEEVGVVPTRVESAAAMQRAVRTPSPQRLAP